MGLLDSLKSLFGGAGTGAASTSADPVDYNGYTIQPKPKRRDGGWNTAGVISKTIEGDPKEHPFIRVDTHSNLDDAISFSVAKARQIIDEQGDSLFRSKR